MDTSFLSNPVNTGITAITIMAVVGGVLWFLSKRRISVGKDGIVVADIEQRLSDKIPMIDRRHQNAMRDITSDNKDSILGLMSIEDKSHQLLVLFKVLDVIRHKIYVNHLTRRFSNEAEYAKWKQSCIDEVDLKLRYVENYTNQDIDIDKAKKDLSLIFDKLKSLLVPELENMIREKLTYYNSLQQTDKVKELIEKNEKYLRGLLQ